jgi:hypothetical protein
MIQVSVIFLGQVEEMVMTCLEEAHQVEDHRTVSVEEEAHQLPAGMEEEEAHLFKGFCLQHRLQHRPQHQA